MVLPRDYVRKRNGILRIEPGVHQYLKSEETRKSKQRGGSELGVKPEEWCSRKLV